MADKTVDPAFDADEISGLFNKAKSQGGAFNFAFGLGQKPEESALIVHLRKGGAALKQEVKSLPGKIGKTCLGTFTVAESEVRFFSPKPLKGMIKALKKRFRDAGMAKFKPVLIGTDGKEIDEDTLPDNTDEDDEDDVPVEDVATEAADEAEAAEAAAQDLTPLKRRLAAIVPRVQALAPEMADKLRQACLIANQQIGNADIEGATRSMDQIEAALARVEGTATAPQAEVAQAPLARLQDALGKLVARIRTLGEGDARNMLVTQARDIGALIKEGAVERAITALKTLSQDLTAAEQIGSAPTAPTLDALAVWREAKEACDVGVSALQQKILSFDDPDLRRIGEFGLNGVTDGVQTALMAALFSYNSTSGAERAKAAAVVAARAAEARKLLEGDAIIALVEENPFGVKVDIRGTLGAALKQLEALAT